jgi:hypothetical protein
MKPNPLATGAAPAPAPAALGAAPKPGKALAVAAKGAPEKPRRSTKPAFGAAGVCACVGAAAAPPPTNAEKAISFSDERTLGGALPPASPPPALAKAPKPLPLLPPTE